MARAPVPPRDRPCLELECAAGAATTGLLKVAAVDADAGLDVASGLAWVAKVAVGLASSAAAAQQDCVRALGLQHGELIKGQHLQHK